MEGIIIIVDDKNMHLNLFGCHIFSKIETTPFIFIAMMFLMTILTTIAR